MARSTLVVFAMMFLGGCGGPIFTNLGNGVGVPPASIDDHATANGITGEEARARMLEDFEQQRIAEYAQEHGVSLEEAERQLKHAAR